MTQEHTHTTLTTSATQAIHIGQAKWHVLIGMLCGSILAFILLSSLQPEYKTEMILAPAQKSSSSDFAGLLPGANIPALQFFTKQITQLSSAEFLTFENTLLSSRVAEQLKNDPEILTQLNLVQNRVTDIRDYLQKEVRIYPVGSTPLRRVFIYHTDPVFAQKFLQHMYDTTDALIKADTKQRAEQLLSHLDTVLQNTRSPDHREALTALLKEQQHIKLMTSIDMPFAAQLIEPPIAGSKSARPDPYLLYPALILLGAFLGYILAYLKHSNA